MHDRAREIEARLVRVLDERLRPAVHAAITPLKVEVWEVPPDPDGHVGEPVPFETARAASYRPFRVGERWGPAWGTAWFHLSGTVPTHG